MPIFGDDIHIDNTQSKSWGVYILLKDTYSLTMDVPKGENISFSISVPTSYEKHPDLTVTLFGHGASDINCDSEFNGWGTKPEWSERRRLDTGLDSTKQIVTHDTSKKEFEQFGVGGYRPVAACQGQALIGDDLFRLTIINNDSDDVPLTIGVGMAESFGFVELLLMSFTILQTWLWAGKGWSLVIPIVAVLWYVLYLMKQTPDIFKFPSLNNFKENHQDILEKLAYLCGLFVIVSASQFLVHIIYTAVETSLWGSVWLPFVLHVVMPIVMYIVFSWYYDINLNASYGTLKHFGVGILMVGYLFAFLWQSYCIPLFSFIAFMVLKWYFTPMYALPH